MKSYAAKRGARGVIRQARSDLKRGLVDTDLRGRASKKKKWSAGVMRRSNALDLEQGDFTKRTPRAVAQSLKRSAEHSRRRKSAPFRSAMSMLNFEINRAGSNLPKSRRAVLEKAKDELRKLYGRPPEKKDKRGSRFRGNDGLTAAFRPPAPARRARAARGS
jgi:hypothetical protein